MSVKITLDLSSGNLEASQLEKVVLDEQQKGNCEEILNCLSLEGKELTERFENWPSKIMIFSLFL
jgi:hypothetical protein